MAEQTTAAGAGEKRRVELDIPWMHRWDRQPDRESSAAEEDHALRLIRIDYMTMLQELEFR